MIRNFLIAATLLAASGPALAQAPLSQNPPTQTVICLDVGGQTLPVSCRVPASRLDKREDICTCPRGMRVDVSICPPGVKPQAETRAFDRARRDLMQGDMSLIGDTFEGRPICVAPRNP
ncbi:MULTISPECIES: LptA/OstA family protein [Phenylobacterium]|uniref:Uncharacterized protein n=1 Tax=Phenylobacterium koreense TaxID=266125 RepID=A0ABV2EE15_9CAUL